MTDPDKNRPTEIELEMKQRQRLMALFSLVETFDEAIDRFLNGAGVYLIGLAFYGFIGWCVYQSL